jgi:hypothetical protein
LAKTCAFASSRFAFTLPRLAFGNFPIAAVHMLIFPGVRADGLCVRDNSWLC